MTPPKKHKKLQHKELMFAEAVLRGEALTDAAEQAGYKAKNRNTMKSLASEIAKKPHIKAYIAERTSDEIITTDAILTGIRDIALNCQERASDRLRAYELLGKNKSLFTDKQDVTLTGSLDTRLILPEDDDGGR